MKLTIFNKGKGWYVSASNYKDENDKAYMGVMFSKTNDIPYQDNGRGFSVQKIDVHEAKFTSYKGKVGMFIYKYDLLSDIPMEDTSNFGGNRADSYQSLDIGPNDLPFY